jgi:hypothetical protein
MIEKGGVSENLIPPLKTLDPYHRGTENTEPLLQIGWKKGGVLAHSPVTRSSISP